MEDWELWDTALFYFKADVRKIEGPNGLKF